MRRGTTGTGSGAGGHDVYFAGSDKLLCTAAGGIVDPSTKTLVRQFPTSDFLVDKGPTINAAANRAYYITWDSSTAKHILSFNLKTKAEYAVTDTGVLPGGAKRLLSCGSHSVVFYIFGPGITHEVVIVRRLP